MASISISASLQRACSSNHVTKRSQPQPRAARSLGTKQTTNVVTLNVEGQKQEKSPSYINKADNDENEAKDDLDSEFSVPKFSDERWKNGTWDLNMFVRNGKMDWDGLIVAGETSNLNLILIHVLTSIPHYTLVSGDLSFWHVMNSLVVILCGHFRSKKKKVS